VRVEPALEATNTAGRVALGVAVVRGGRRGVHVAVDGALEDFVREPRAGRHAELLVDLVEVVDLEAGQREDGDGLAVLSVRVVGVELVLKLRELRPELGVSGVSRVGRTISRLCRRSRSRCRSGLVLDDPVLLVVPGAVILELLALLSDFRVLLRQERCEHLLELSLLLLVLLDFLLAVLELLVAGSEDVELAVELLAEGADLVASGLLRLRVGLRVGGHADLHSESV
jgi:hypothetical protein